MRYGQRVKVRATARRIVGRVQGGVLRDVWEARDRRFPGDGGRSVHNPLEGWPGEGLTELPDKDGTFVRIRRFPLTEPTEAIVIGESVRYEGTRWHGSYESYYGGDSGGLGAQHRVKLITVALPTEGIPVVAHVCPEDLDE